MQTFCNNLFPLKGSNGYHHMNQSLISHGNKNTLKITKNNRKRVHHSCKFSLSNLSMKKSPMKDCHDSSFYGSHGHRHGMKRKVTRSVVESEGFVASEGWFSKMRKDYGSDLMFFLGYGYWIQGFRVFPWLAMNFYLKDNLKVSPATLQFLQNTVNFPMVAKPVYGIVSDAVYIRGAHRLPYVFVGGLLQALSWGTIALIPMVGSSIPVLTVFLLLSNLGASVGEVANDALVAECGKKYQGKLSGQLQSFAWMTMSAGSVLGNLIAGLIVSQVHAKTMFLMFFSLMGVQMWTSLHFKENSFGLTNMKRANNIKTNQTNKPSALPLITETLGLECKEASLTTSIRNQISDITKVLKKPEISSSLVWFAASYAMVPLLTGTMFFYYTQHLNIEPGILGLAKVVGQMGLLVGSYVYNRFLKDIPLRKLICFVQILLSISMLGDLLLVKQINIQMGISNEAYVIGASAFVEAIAQFKILPFTVLLAQLCPHGCEGSLMAFFMSVQCLASIVSGYLGVGLASLVGVSGGNYSTLPFGIFVQSMATLVPLIWISYVPNAKIAEKEAMKTLT